MINEKRREEIIVEFIKKNSPVYLFKIIDSIDLETSLTVRTLDNLTKKKIIIKTNVDDKTYFSYENDKIKPN